MTLTFNRRICTGPRINHTVKEQVFKQAVSQSPVSVIEDIGNAIVFQVIGDYRYQIVQTDKLDTQYHLITFWK